MKETVLELVDVRKSIRNKEIVKGINLTVRESEVVGFLGHNGAGKTTTIRIIVGLIKPTSGTVSICGYDNNRQFEQAMAHIGCMIESPDMYRYMSGMANLKHFANMGRVRIGQKRIDEVVELVGLTDCIHNRVEEYSTGMCQRLGLAQAVMGSPKLLILDEPTNGLDPSGIREFREMVRFLAEHEKMGILVSSHILSEMELMCDRVAFICNGELLKTGYVDELIRKQRICWHVSDHNKAAELLKSRWNLQADRLDHNRVAVSLDDHQVSEINETFIEHGMKIHYVYKEAQTLEDVFMKMTK